MRYFLDLNWTFSTLSLDPPAAKKQEVREEGQGGAKTVPSSFEGQNFIFEGFPSSDKGQNFKLEALGICNISIIWGEVPYSCLSRSLLMMRRADLSMVGKQACQW